MNAKRNQYEQRGEVTALTITKLNGERFECLVDTAETPRIRAKTWGMRFDQSMGKYYVQHSWRESGKTRAISLHRLLTGAIGYEQKVDHINHNALDNRSVNLRIVSNAVNTSNRRGASRANKSSGIRGVSWEPTHRSWKAQAGFNGRKLNLGRYKDKFEAGRVVQEFWKNTGRIPEAAREVCDR